jgi:hypothetical protein
MAQNSKRGWTIWGFSPETSAANSNLWAKKQFTNKFNWYKNNRTAHWTRKGLWFFSKTIVSWFFYKKIERKKYSSSRFFPKQIMVYFGKIISSLHDKELKDFWLRDKPIGFYLPFKLSGRSLTKLHIILVMKSWIANLSKVKKLWLFGRKTNKERTKNGKFTSF